MDCKLEKTKKANEVKLKITVEAEKFDDAIKGFISKVRNTSTYQASEEERHQYK